MKTRLCSAVAAIALIAGVGAASAAETGMMKSGHAALSLTSTQRRDIYQDVSKLKTSETSPANFTARVGEAVPSSIGLRPLPERAAKQVPAVRSYDYAMLGKEVLIVNRSTKEIADVITE
jgi:Protein of unknown function (DUF1236)